MKNIDFNKFSHIHFIGIGGIGVSALARMFLLEGKKVSGSDAKKTQITEELKKLGAKIFYKHSSSNIPRTKDVLIIYTKAVGGDNPEIKEAQKRKLSSLSYSQALGAISSNKYTIAVSGAHGKTTTTGMIAFGLIKAKKNPTVVVGSFLKDFSSNFIAGKSDYFIVEACEYKKSFLDLNPKIVVITNIDNDHLDYYKNISNIKEAFKEFVKKVPKDGFLICDLSGKYIKEVAKVCKGKVIDYSERRMDFKLKLIGDHNISNAKAAACVMDVLGVSKENIKKSLLAFSGTARRMEFKGQKKGVLIYDDYAHHPTEIKATLKSFKDNFPGRKIFCLFQPHLYSRTKLLLNDFSKSFNDVDFLGILPIFAAREKEDRSISSKILLNKIKSNGFKGGAETFDDFNKALKFFENNLRKGDILLTMGAGDAFKIGESFLN